MEKYKTYEFIKEEDLSDYGSLKKELITYVVPSSKPKPLMIESFGVTHADPAYYIKRQHCNYFVFEYVVSGKGYLTYNNKEFVLDEETVYILEPGSTHAYRADRNTPFTKYWINFKSDIFGEIIKSYRLSDITTFKSPDCKPFFEEILRLDIISVSNTEIYHRASELLFQIIMTLSKNIKKASAPSQLASEIKNHLDNAIVGKTTIEKIAKNIFISKPQLINEFKKYYHQTPYAYLLDKKIELAKRILTDSNKSIKKIAELLCFSDEHYFSNLFKNKVGVSPKEYRENRPTLFTHNFK